MNPMVEMMDGDLISRSALLAEYDRVHVGPPGGARKLMVDAPAVDAVEVVRCKDCKSYRYDEDFERTMCGIFIMGTDSEGFCSYGERKDNATD